MGETNDETPGIIGEIASLHSGDVFTEGYTGPVAVEVLEGDTWREVAVFNEQSEAAERIDELVAEGMEPNKVRMVEKKHHHFHH
jgi:hypothetical protein